MAFSSGAGVYSLRLAKNWSFKQKEREEPNERSNFMADESRKAPNPQSAHTLKDDEIITERKLSRRSFVTVAGTLLAGGAAFLVAGSAASAQDQTEKDDEPACPHLPEKNA